jgi:hypothetical protein
MPVYLEQPGEPKYQAMAALVDQRKSLPAETVGSKFR